MKSLIKIAFIAAALAFTFTAAEARGHKGHKGHRSHHGLSHGSHGHHNFIWGKNKIYCNVNGVVCPQ